MDSRAEAAVKGTTEAWAHSRVQAVMMECSRSKVPLEVRAFREEDAWISGRSVHRRWPQSSGKGVGRGRRHVCR